MGFSLGKEQTSLTLVVRVSVGNHFSKLNRGTRFPSHVTPFPLSNVWNTISVIFNASRANVHDIRWIASGVPISRGFLSFGSPGLTALASFNSPAAIKMFGFGSIG